MFELNGKYSNAKVMIDNVEPECVSQIVSFLNHPAFTNPVAIMPDCHFGKSSCIGFTMPMTDKIIPNVIGVDLGCGMLSVNLGKTLTHSLEKFDELVRKAVPFGFDCHSKPVYNMERQFDWKKFDHTLKMKITEIIKKKFTCSPIIPNITYEWYEDLIWRVGADKVRVSNSVGSAGGGNHFLELGKDDSDNLWLTVHTGSRNLGKQICEYWQDKAINLIKNDKQKLMNDKIDQIRKTCHGSAITDNIKKARQELGIDNIPNKDLCYLEKEDAIGYLLDMMMAQEYARLNREQIMSIIVDKILNIKPIDKIECVHNFIDFSDLIVRKGSIRSYIGERMIIPFNMRDGILICEGKSNPEWNFSAPHGAGRLMSRSKAKATLKMDEFKDQMKEIYSSSVCPGTLDEAPNAYKDARIIEEAIEPTAKILFKIKPIFNMKDKAGKERD